MIELPIFAGTAADGAQLYALCALASIIAATLSMAGWMKNGGVFYGLLSMIFGALALCSMILWI